MTIINYNQNDYFDPKIVLAIAPINFIKWDYSLFNYADEFYLWYVNIPKVEWNETLISNKRWYRYSNFNISNDEHIDILKKINKYKKKLDKKISLVLNNIGLLNDLNNLKQEIDYILSLIQIDRFIAADFYILKFVQENYPNIQVNLSSLALFSNISHFNLIKDFPNIKRIILHRDIDEDTILSFLNYLEKNNLNIELEFFAMNEWCYNIDWLCYSLHNIDEHIPFVCQRNWLYKNKYITGFMQKRSNCQICLLWTIKNIDKIEQRKKIFQKVNFFKIPWRWHNNLVLKDYAIATKQLIKEIQKKWYIWFDKKEEIFQKTQIIWKQFNIMFCWNCYFKNI